MATVCEECLKGALGLPFAGPSFPTLRGAMRLRNWLLPALTILAIAVAGCGGGSDGGGSGDPLESALSYAPKDTPFAMAIDTDVDGDQFKALGDLADKFPFGRQITQQLQDQLMKGTSGVSYEDDLKPLLGNPFVVSAADPRTFTDENVEDDFVAAIQAKDGDKLKDVLEKSGAKEQGEKSGATIYDESGTQFAVKDDTLIVAGSAQLLDAALARSEKGEGLSQADFDSALEDLPEDAIARVYVDMQAVIANDPGALEARKVAWVGALRTLGLTAKASGDDLAIDFDLKTQDGLTDADLPLAPGAASPGVIEQPGEINLGLRDPSQIVRFAESAAQAVSPASFGQYTQAKAQIEKGLGISIDDDLIAQLKGDVSVNVAVNGTFGVRAELKDPAAFKATLAKLADVLPKFAEGAGAGAVGLAKPKGNQQFYALAQPDGDNIVFGVVGDVFVLANDPARAGRLATATPEQVPGAKGSLVMKADGRELANQLIGQLGEDMVPGGAVGGRLFTGPLGDLTGSVETSTGGMRGSFKLAVK